MPVSPDNFYPLYNGNFFEEIGAETKRYISKKPVQHKIAVS
jgi:hypothetical protein